MMASAIWTTLTYQIIGLAMELHNELGPGHREITYHNGMLIKLQSARRAFESEPYIYLNFGRPRLEIRRLFPPQTVRAYRRDKWGRLDAPSSKRG